MVTTVTMITSGSSGFCVVLFCSVETVAEVNFRCFLAKAKDRFALFGEDLAMTLTNNFFQNSFNIHIL